MNEVLPFGCDGGTDSRGVIRILYADRYHTTDCRLHTVEGRQEARRGGRGTGAKRGGRDHRGLKGLRRSKSMKVILKIRKEYGRSEGWEFELNA